MNQELINNIKNWINVDNEIKKLQKNIKSLREEKKKFTIVYLVPFFLFITIFFKN